MHPFRLNNRHRVVLSEIDHRENVRLINKFIRDLLTHMPSNVREMEWLDSSVR